MNIGRQKNVVGVGGWRQIIILHVTITIIRIQETLPSNSEAFASELLGSVSSLLIVVNRSENKWTLSKQLVSQSLVYTDINLSSL